jgi:hypothetical protein
MRKRRLLKSHVQAEEEQQASSRRFPHGIYWTLLAILLLVAVWQYDQGEKKIARQHISSAETFAAQAEYISAIQEYRHAMENPRLSRKEKAQIAIKIAQLYADNLHDAELALAFYNQARRFYPASVSRPEIKAKLAELKDQIGVLRSAELAEKDEDTSEATSRVVLLSPPVSDLKGPVVAQVCGRDIHAGALARYLRSKADYQYLVLHPEAPKFDEAIKEFFEREMAYLKAVDERLHERPGLAEQLYDYQRLVLAQHYRKEFIDTAEQPDEKEIRAFYEKYKQRFLIPERIVVGAIGSTTESKVLEAKQLFAQGVRWEDLVTSYCESQSLRAMNGLLGTITPSDKTLPVFGEVPELIKNLATLPPKGILGPMQINHEYILFAILEKLPKQEKSLEEVRPQIEVILRSEKQSQRERGMKSTMNQSTEMTTVSQLKKLLVEYLKNQDRENTSTITHSQPGSDQ